MQGVRRLLLACALTLALIVLHSQPARAASSATPAAAAVIAAAHALLGAPYAYIGDDPRTGFSCIGFVHYLFARIGVYVPYSLDLAYAAGPRVHDALEPGDLLFFSNTVWKGLSHVALYAGDDQVIGADNFTSGVELTHLSNHYWASHFTGATRPLAGITTPLSPIVEPPPPPTPPITVLPGQLLSGRGTGDVYSGPGYGYQRIDRLPPRASLRVVRIAAPWANVTYHGDGTDYFGWVDAGYLAECRPVSLPKSPPARPAVVAVTAGVLYLRGAPSTNAPILRHLALGQRLTLLGQQRDWDHVRVDNVTGWAYARWLETMQ